MIDIRSKFSEALATFAQAGNRWEGLKHVTYWAAANGMTEDDVIEAAHGAGVFNRDTSIRRGMVSAYEKVRANAERFGRHTNAPRASSARRPRTTHQTAEPLPTDRVRQLIEAGCDATCDETLRALSPASICPDLDELSRKVMCEMQLLTMFTRSDMVRIRRSKSDNSRSTIGQNLKTLNDWLRDVNHPIQYGEIVRVNPLTGELGLTRDNRPSYDAQSCIAAFRHMVLEFDDLPLTEQLKFWAGFVRQSPFAKHLLFLVRSGSKSIHGVIRVDAPDAETWMRYRSQLIRLYASDPDKRYRLDDQALMPLTGCRLAGARRADTGEVQTLIYASASWRDAEWQTEMNPPVKAIKTQPSTEDADGFAEHCRTCQSVDLCKHRFGRFWSDRSSGGKGCNNPI